MDPKLPEIVERLRSVSITATASASLPTDDLMDVYEREVGLTFPDDYRYFLTHASDCIYNGLNALRLTPERGARDELAMAINTARSMGLPTSLLPICEDNGDYFCLDATGCVVFWDHNGGSDESWSNLADWIEDVWLNGN